MKLLQLLLSSLCVICAHTKQDESCQDGRMPASCESVPNPCENAVCPYYSEAECRVDACNNCSHLFYDDETGTVLKCNDEPLLCASCLKQDGDTCEPGVEVKTVQCDQDELCGNFEAIFQTEEYNISVSYQGCVSSHTFERKEPSCYENDDFKERFKSVFNTEAIRGYGCVCTEDMCNNVDLYTPTIEEIISCVDDVGLWFNPGYFLVDEKCDARFCDNRGEFRCIAEELTSQCKFDGCLFENGERFKSGIRDCVCVNGDVSCAEGDQPGLVCYTSSSLTDELSGILICEEDSVCLVGKITQLSVSNLTTYERGCYKKELLKIEAGCTTSFDDVQDTFPNYHPGDFFSICICNTSYCNEKQQLTEPGTGFNCSYNGDVIDHNYEFNKDECNLCKCHQGDVLCTSYPCKPSFCEFDDYLYESGEKFKSGIGNCVCNDGTISCSKGDHAELVCYTSPSLSYDKVTGIEICSEDSVCLVGVFVQREALPHFIYMRGCYNNTLLENGTNCTFSVEEIQGVLPLHFLYHYYCVCSTSFCNEKLQPRKEVTGAKCSYNGDLIDHNLVFDKDECNLCKCHNGEVFCTTHPCTEGNCTADNCINGQCYVYNEKETCKCYKGYGLSPQNDTVCVATPNETAMRLPMSTPKPTRESLESTGQPLNRSNQQIDSSNSPIIVSNGILIVISLVLLLLLVTFTFIVIRKKQKSISQKDIQFHRDKQKHNDSKEPEMDVPIEFKGKEITNRAYILVESEPLGRGQYGDVYRGTLIGLNGNMERTIVAVKTPKCDASVAMKEDFLDEIKLITDIGEHPHIMPLYGCCTMTEPYYLITEFMKYGALDNFLLRCRNMENAVLDPIYNLEELNQVQIAWQISKGMAFLSTTKFFHGDLAARNCLVGSNLIVKISDFGLSDDIYLRGYKRIASEKKRPVKWYSPEANLDGVCSTKGDVWSYGVVMWEIYTLGDIPYPGMPAPEVIERIANGYRLPPPDGCPSDIYAVMLECWQQSPKERPTFSELEKTLELLLHQRADKDIQVATSEQNRSPYLHIEDQQGEPTASSRKSSLAAKLNLNIFFGTSSDLPKMDKSNPSSASPKEYSEIVGKTIPSVKSLEKSLPPSDKRWSADSFDFDPELISGDSESVVFLNILDEENGSVEAEEIAYIGDCNFALAEEDREISFS